MNKRIYFFMKKNRVITPVEDESLQLEAKELLELLMANKEISLPARYRIPEACVALYSPKGELKNANAIIIQGDDGAYNLDNRLNDLDGKSWTKFTCSWFIFNALASDLKEEREITASTQDHPATFSPTMISSFIEFFTKEGMNVFDPFCGIGTTLVAARRTRRQGYGIELNQKYFDIAQKRVPEFSKNLHNASSEHLDSIEMPLQDFSISSPPYWNVLNRSTRDFHHERDRRGLDKTYSDKETDLGNIDDYDEFIRRLCDIYVKMNKFLRPKAYIVIILKNVKRDGKFYPLAWDVASELSKTYEIKDEKIWIQDKIGLAPYGYPYSWVSNILHHYCLIFQKN